MLILAFILSFITSCIAMYIVSFFSGESTDLPSVLLATAIIWVVSTVLNLLQITGPIGIIISTLVSMFTLIKFFGFEPITSFFAGALYATINYILLAVIISLLVT